MVYALKVFKKTSPNSKVTVYLGKRDYIDNITKIESVGKCSLAPHLTNGIVHHPILLRWRRLDRPRVLKGPKTVRSGRMQFPLWSRGR